MNFQQKVQIINVLNAATLKTAGKQTLKEKFTEGFSSTVTKDEIAKDIYVFANVKRFWTLMWKKFCHSGGENSIKTKLQTCNLHTGQSINYKSVN